MRLSYWVSSESLDYEGLVLACSNRAAGRLCYPLLDIQMTDEPCQCVACVRARDSRDRSHIPSKQQPDPNARTWHWNEHPKGKFLTKSEKPK